ncbi:cation diffusion facilitator family transporter [Georgenia sp. MJ173]|uniref:cation diffusion facilitator family transporter n=1 Tax=Georgenia sunbinii TaxID=3117728 RepID=UPI002F264DE4
MATEGSTKAVVTALAANLGIAVTKFTAWLLTGSSSMLAEGVHSVADSSNQALLLLGGRRARRVANTTHQFGYGRARYLYAFIVSIVLFSLGGLFALYEGYHKWSHPEPITAWQWVPPTVLALAMVMEAYALHTAVKEANAVRGKQPWLQYVRKTRSPELPVILLEDTGALLGLVFAMAGVSLTLVTGDGRWDAAGTAAIGVLLVVIAIFLAIEMGSMLLGEGALPEQHGAIEQALLGDGVESVIHLRTLHLGPDEILVAAKIEVTRTDTAEEVATAIDDAEQRVRDAVTLRTQIYLEPDLRRSAGPGAGRAVGGE